MTQYAERFPTSYLRNKDQQYALFSLLLVPITQISYDARSTECQIPTSHFSDLFDVVFYKDVLLLEYTQARAVLT